jgi:hypothetical protein
MVGESAVEKLHCEAGEADEHRPLLFLPRRGTFGKVAVGKRSTSGARKGSWWLGVHPRSDGDFLFGSSALTAVPSEAYPSASQRRSWTTNGPR